MKKFSVPFGKEQVTFELPENQVAGVLVSHAHEYQAPKSETEFVADALAHPIDGPTLSELAKGKKHARLFPVTIHVQYQATLLCRSY